MTEDQRFVLEQLVEAVVQEKPDAVIIAGDLYDRAVPPTEAVELLDEVLQHIVADLHTPVLAISGNHDSPDRLSFGTRLMRRHGLHLVGHVDLQRPPAVLEDEYGEVHFHLVPYADPAQVRLLLDDDSIRSHDDAMRAITREIASKMDKQARHVFIGHAFVTPKGEAEANTSDSERPLSIGGADHVSSVYFDPFSYVALGHLHQAHYVRSEHIRYSGSPLKYSVSEANHLKGFYLVELRESGVVHVEKRELVPRRQLRQLRLTLEQLAASEPSEDYVFVTLLSDSPVLFPMEKVRAVFPNAMHVERQRLSTDAALSASSLAGNQTGNSRRQADPQQLFAAFYEQVNGQSLTASKQQLFAKALQQVQNEEVAQKGEGR